MGKQRENRHKPRREGKKITVGKTEDVPAGRSATVKLKGGAEVALFNSGGKFYAIENFCPHKGVPLADSPLHGSTRSNAICMAGVLISALVNVSRKEAVQSKLMK